MAQFDVYRSPNPRTFPLLVDVQADLLGRLESRVVIPLLTVERYGAKPITRLHPLVKLDAVEYVVMTHQVGALPALSLAKRVGTLASYRSTIITALDLLLTGS